MDGKTTVCKRAREHTHCTHVDSRGTCKALVTMAAHGGDWMVEDRDGNLHFTACLSFQVPWLPM